VHDVADAQTLRRASSPDAVHANAALRDEMLDLRARQLVRRGGMPQYRQVEPPGSVAAIGDEAVADPGPPAATDRDS
jgi:hypothetical protein